MTHKVLKEEKYDLNYSKFSDKLLTIFTLNMSEIHCNFCIFRSKIFSIWLCGPTMCCSAAQKNSVVIGLDIIDPCLVHISRQTLSEYGGQRAFCCDTNKGTFQTRENPREPFISSIFLFPPEQDYFISTTIDLLHQLNDKYLSL